MYPFVPTQNRFLATDDNVGISSLYDTWQTLPGSALDIGVASSTSGTAWAVGTDGGVYKFNGSSWDQTDGATALRIAVSRTGIPWVVNTAGEIWRRNSAAVGTMGWTQIAGCARDIGAGDNGSVWVLGCAVLGGGHDINKWRGSVSANPQDNWETAAVGAAVRIAVGPTGIPWVVNNAGGIFRADSNEPKTLTWEQLPGCATDIGISVGNYAWVIGCDADADNFGIHVWDKQEAVGTAPAVAAWIKMPGAARNISVGPNARPWVVNNGGGVFQALR